MGEAAFLAYDIGTTALKAALIDARGNMLASASRAYPTYYNGPVAEQRPEDWWACVCEATREMLARHPEYVGRVDAIGLSGHMSGCVAVDARGIPLMRALIHADSRAERQAQRIEREISGRTLYERTGCVLDAKNTLCKLLWLREKRPEVYARAARFLQSKDYVAFRLTGNLDTTDYSDASHAMLFDIAARRYMDDVLRDLGIDVGKLPEVHRGTEVIGALSQEAAQTLGLPQGIPVVAGGGDGACATAGAGISGPGEAYCSLGTTAWIAFLSREPVIDREARIFDIMTLDGDGFGVFGTMQTAGRSMEWAQELFGLESIEELSASAALAPPGSSGLIFLPYLEGERSPVFDSRARGLFFGIGIEHRREHFLRAVIEGSAYALRSILEACRECRDIPRLRVTGGGARSALWLEAIANAGNVELELPQGAPTSQTAMGAALAAGVGAGVYPNLRSATGIVKRGDTVRPDPASRAVYDAAYAKYRELYPRMRDLYYM